MNRIKNAIKLTWVLGIFAMSAQAAVLNKQGTEQILSAVKCASQVKAVLSEWKSQNDWHPQVDTVDGQRSFVSPTAKIGLWVELRIATDNRAEAIRVSPEVITQVAWTDENCTPALGVIRSNGSLKKAKNVFTDADLETFIKANPNSLIYSWSPHMPYSIDGLIEIQTAAKQLKMKVMTVLDPRAELAFAEQEAARMKSRVPASLHKMESVELIYRNMTLHYPSVLIVSKGKITGPMLPGLMPADDYTKIIAERVK